MASIKELEKEINKIKKRNKRVEADKDWETSWERKIIIAVLTYILISVFFLITGLPNPFANALMATTAFILSTLTLSLFKQMWINKRK